MKELDYIQVGQVNGGFPPAVVALLVVAGRHYGQKVAGAAISGFVGGVTLSWLKEM